MAGRAWEGSERSLRLRAEVGVGRRPNLPPTQAAGQGLGYRAVVCPGRRWEAQLGFRKTLGRAG